MSAAEEVQIPDPDAAQAVAQVEPMPELEQVEEAHGEGERLHDMSALQSLEEQRTHLIADVKKCRVIPFSGSDRLSAVGNNRVQPRIRFTLANPVLFGSIIFHRTKRNTVLLHRERPEVQI